MSIQRSWLNLNGGEFYREHRLINCAREGQRPLCSLASGLGYLSVTADAFPTEFTTGVSFTVYVPPNADGSPVACVARWKGAASYSHVSFGATTPAGGVVGGVTYLDATQSTQVVNGRMTFTVSSGFASAITIKGDGRSGAANQLIDFVICRADEEALLDAGQVFRPAFLALLAGYKGGGLRFMDKQQANYSILANWADRPRLTALTVNYQAFNQDKIVSGNANPGEIVRTGTDVYSASTKGGTSGSYQHGEMYHGHVVISNTTTTPTLNIDGRGAKVISLGSQGALTTAGTNYQTQMIAAGTTLSGHLVGPYDFTYDAFYDQWMLAEGAPGLGEPLELMVALCNAANTGGWFNLPVYMTDDCVTQFGNYLVANWTSGGQILISWGNEIWNPPINYTNRIAKWGDQTFTSPQIGTGNNADISAYYGLRLSQVAAILRPIFAAAGKSSLLKIVLESRGGAGDTASGLVTEVENVRFQNTAYASISGANAPIGFSDYVAYAIYHCPSATLGGKSAAANSPTSADSDWAATSNSVTLKGYVDAWVVDNSQTAGFAWLHDQWLADPSVQAMFTNAGGRGDNWNALAAKYGKQVVHYEMNQQVLAPSSTWTAANAPWNSSSYGNQSGKINQFLLAFYKSSYWQDVNTQLLTQFYGRNRSLASTIYGMCTLDPWLTFPRIAPLTETIGGDTTQPPYGNWLAHKAWNNKTTRVFALKN